MLLGIDVGGTHTDVVVIAPSGVVGAAKVNTDPENLLASVRQALEEVRSVLGGQVPTRFALSTTLCTNALVQGTTEAVGMVLFGGPGIDPSLHAPTPHCTVVPGVVDHRGSVLEEFEAESLEQVVEQFAAQGLSAFACVGKFSPRNPEFEQQAAHHLASLGGWVTQGHHLSGELNFPRRINTAYFNSAVWTTFNGFADAVAAILDEYGFNCPVNLLKADAGTLPLQQARRVPVETIFSGPAASVMGISALCQVQDEAVLLDIGGTTTDVALFAGGVPVIERHGISLEGRPTLVKGLKTRSVGIGGDSAIEVHNGSITVGPQRFGPCLAQGGTRATLVDALNVTGRIAYGDTAASFRGLETVAYHLDCSPARAAESVVEAACAGIRDAVQDLLAEVNQRPVYTVHEVLWGKGLHPQHLLLMGGPAAALAPCLEKALDMQASVPEHAAVANAIGAALARPTVCIELFADTQQRVMRIPALGVERSIGAGYDLEAAKQDALAALQETLEDSTLESGAAEILESSSMNMVRGMSMVGRDIRVRCQVRPGIASGYETTVRSVC